MNYQSIQLVIFLFHTFKDTKFAKNILPPTPSKIRNNSNLTMLALTMSFGLKVIMKAYKLRK